jgi:hypothetical protein
MLKNNMTPQKYFTKENDFYYVSPDVLKLSETISLPKKFEYETKTLERNMNDQEILKELKPDLLSLSEIAYCLTKLGKSGWYLFYPKEDKSLVVYAFWYGAFDGWRVDASEVGYPSTWDAGNQVVSSKFGASAPLDKSLGNLDSLTLRIEDLEDWAKNIGYQK